MKFYIICFYLLTTSLFASTKVRIDFHDKRFQQGSIQQAEIILDETFVQKIEVQKLTSKILGETLYLHEVGPILKTGDSPSFKAKAQVVFVKIPQSDSVSYKLGSEEIVFSWSAVDIIPLEASEGFVFEDFEISKRFKKYYWFFLLLVGVPLAYIFFRFNKKLELKKKVKQEKEAVLKRLLATNQYEEIVKLWVNKNEIYKTYPELNEFFKDVEKVLFLYQFKPTQSQNEKDHVVKVYQEMITKFQGSLRGV